MILELEPFSVPSLDKVAPFMGALERIRANLSNDEWKRTSKVDPILRRWRFYLSSDPYTRWGLIKPRGYPGDATLMDFAYGHPSVSSHLEAAGRVGAQIYSYTSGAPQSESARQRIGLVRDEISEKALVISDLTLISFASGHARELEGLHADIAGSIRRFVALDADWQSLAIAEASGGRVPIVPVRVNVIKDELPSIDAAHLVYSLGLFDYLSDDDATRVLSRMWSVVAPGGRLLIANLSPEAANLGYCESIMDWWMITRDERAMHRLAWTLHEGDTGGARIQVSRKGCFNYLVIDRDER